MGIPSSFIFSAPRGNGGGRLGLISTKCERGEESAEENILGKSRERERESGLGCNPNTPHRRPALLSRHTLEQKDLCLNLENIYRGK